MIFEKNFPKQKFFTFLYKIKKKRFEIGSICDLETYESYKEDYQVYNDKLRTLECFYSHSGFKSSNKIFKFLYENEFRRVKIFILVIFLLLSGSNIALNTIFAEKIFDFNNSKKIFDSFLYQFIFNFI